MARSVRKAFRRNNGGGGGGNDDDELRKQAVEAVKERNEAALQNLVKLQSREIKMLEGEQTWIGQARARDMSAFNNREITAINQRYDRLQHNLQRKHNSFFGKLHRVVGGHKHQQRRMDALTAERDRVVANRTKQHVQREAQRQRSLTERDMRVEKDLQEAQERHAVDRDQFRQQREQGFELAVRQEVNRLQQIQQPKPRM